jgi:hypothetical protein
MRLISFFLVLNGFLLFSSFSIVKDEKPSVILFMLHQSTKKIEVLKRKGFLKEARIMELEDQDLNESIMNDMNAHFDFCPVYFFYSNQFENVIAKKWQEVQLISSNKNASLNALEILENSNATIYIAEVNYPPAEKYPVLNGATEIESSSYADGGYVNARDPYGILLHKDNFDLIGSKLVYTKANVVKLSRKPKKIKFIGAEKLNVRLKNKFK